MQIRSAFAAGAGFGVGAVLLGAVLFATVFSHDSARAADPPTLPNAANQRNEMIAELKAIRELLVKQNALLEARLEPPKGQ